jgi:hypothetical protein
VRLGTSPAKQIKDAGRSLCGESSTPPLQAPDRTAGQVTNWLRADRGRAGGPETAVFPERAGIIGHCNADPPWGTEALKELHYEN